MFPFHFSLFILLLNYLHHSSKTPAGSIEIKKKKDERERIWWFTHSLRSRNMWLFLFHAFSAAAKLNKTLSLAHRTIVQRLSFFFSLLRSFPAPVSKQIVIISPFDFYIGKQNKIIIISIKKLWIWLFACSGTDVNFVNSNKAFPMMLKIWETLDAGK